MTTQSIGQTLRNFGNTAAAVTLPVAGRALTIPFELILTSIHHTAPGAFDSTENDITLNDTNEKHIVAKHIKQELTPKILGPTYDVRIITSQKQEVDSCGGTFLSFKKPVIYIPKAFMNEDSDIKFNDLEKDFLISKELYRTHYNVGLFRVAFLVGLFAMSILMPIFSIPYSVSLVTWGIYIGVFTPTQYHIENHLDQKAIEVITDQILDKIPASGDAQTKQNLAKICALKVASSALNKLRKLNLERKEKEGSRLILPKKFGQLSGSNWWYLFLKPSLGHRSIALNNQAEELISTIKRETSELSQETKGYLTTLSEKLDVYPDPLKKVPGNLSRLLSKNEPA